MLGNYLKVAIRNLLRHRIYSGLNIMGLALGMACCLLMLLYLQHELTYDTFHANADNIYRVA
jgi:putative ABC transport system permease protein